MLVSELTCYFIVSCSKQLKLFFNNNHTIFLLKNGYFHFEEKLLDILKKKIMEGWQYHSFWWIFACKEFSLGGLEGSIAVFIAWITAAFIISWSSFCGLSVFVHVKTIQLVKVLSDDVFQVLISAARVWFLWKEFFAQVYCNSDGFRIRFHLVGYLLIEAYSLREDSGAQEEEDNKS